ncbi:MAG: phage integrase N-terminal SAM-like domain-containing protein [Candidatus Wenzhouxiangella sp. M2_3B_020]
MAEKLLDRMRRIIRVKHYSARTEKAYLHWARRFILFHDKRHPASMGANEVTAFLSHLAVEDVELDRRSIVVRDGKGAKDRVTVRADTRPPATGCGR